MYTAYEHNDITYIVKSDGMTVLQAIVKLRKNIPNPQLALNTMPLTRLTHLARNHFCFDKIEQSQDKDRVNLIGFISHYNIPKSEIVIIPEK